MRNAFTAFSGSTAAWSLILRELGRHGPADAIRFRRGRPLGQSAYNPGYVSRRPHPGSTCPDSIFPPRLFRSLLPAFGPTSHDSIEIG